MSTAISTPPNFLLYNSQQSKQLAVVVDIPGLDYFTSTTIGRNLVYGDPFNYGDPGLIYGGLVPVGAVNGERGHRQLLSLDGGSLTISQQLEPEQGRASISTLNMTFIDKDSYMTQAISPGVIIPEILGQEVKIWLGYPQTSFPDDYYMVWRGRVAQTIPEIGRVTLQFTDPNIVRRQNIFNMGLTALDGDIDDSVTTINVGGNSGFAEKILGPDGTYDLSVKCYIKIDDEFMEYQQTGHEADGFGTDQFLNVARGARSDTSPASIPAAHTDGTEVDGFIELSGSAIDLALKIMLSGWGGPYLEGQVISALGVTGDPLNPVISNAIVLGTSVDAVRDLGLAVGDFITISGATNGGNDVSCKAIAFGDFGSQANHYVLTDVTFISEASSPALLSIRSQYDTLPDACGCRLPSWEVDVAGHVYYQQTFLSNSNNAYSFLISDSNSGPGKTFIESQIMLPLGAYALTRQGRISMGLTKPPLADDRTVVLNRDNVINPQSIKITRGLNIRKYFNEIDWTYDYDDEGNAASLRNTLNTDSLNTIGISSVLPIDSQGARSPGFELIVENRERFLFLRYAKGSVLLDIQTNFGTGNQIEAGDIVIVSDNGGLQIPNLATGKRDFGSQLMEVINRSIDLKSGITQLQLEGGVGALITDRYATISPSSLLDTGTTDSRIIIKDSFGALYPGAEFKKWTAYVGLDIHVHSADYSRSDTTTFIGFDPTNNFAMMLSPALSFTPSVGDIVEIADYPNNTDANDQALYKLVHAFVTPSVAVVSGTSNTVFDVGSGDASKLAVGQTILIHNSDYSTLSDEVLISDVTGTTITVATDLGFTPDNTMTVELIGFPDGGGPYRLI